MLASDVITQARTVIQDTVSPYRQSDPELIGWLNDALAAAAGVRPDLFTEIAQHTCSASAQQTVTIDRALRVAKVLRRTSDSGVVTLFDRGQLDQFNPAWQLDAQGPARQWAPDPNPLRFYVYPPSPANQSLTIELVRGHTKITAIGDNVYLLGDQYVEALASYVAALAEAKDNEFAEGGRVAGLKANFVQLMGQP